MKRITAFGTHLGISAVIFAGLAYLVLFVWYPDLFFATDGGWQEIVKEKCDTENSKQVPERIL